MLARADTSRYGAAVCGHAALFEPYSPGDTSMHRSLLIAASGAALMLAACSQDPAEETGRAAATAPTEVSSSDIDAALARLNLGEPGVFSWEEKTVDGSVVTFTNLTLEAENGPAGTIGEFVIAAPRLDGDVVMFDRVSASNAVLPDEESTVRFDRFVMSNPGPELARTISIALLDLDMEPTEPTAENLSQFGFGEITLEGLSGETSEGETPGEFSLARFSLSDFDGDRLASGALEGVAFNTVAENAGAVTFNLEEVSLEGLSGALLLSSIEAAGAGGGGAAPNFNTMNAIDVYDRFAMRGFDLNAGGVVLDIPELTAEITEVSEGLRSVSSMPRMRLAAEQGPMAAQLAGGLALLGYEELVLKAEGESIYNEAEDRSRTTGENYIELENGFRIDIEQDISGVKAYSDAYLEAAANGALDDGQLPPDVFAPLTLHSMAMRLEDRSLLERGLAAAATAQGMEPDMLRMQAAGLITLGLASAPAELPPELTASLGDGLTGFINNGGTLHVEMNPSEPVNVGDLIEQAQASGAVDMTRLGLAVRNEPPAE